MKGIVFTGFLQMVEESFCYTMVGELIIMSDLPLAGIYTSVGTYQKNTLIMIYTSARKMADVALGLIERCMEHYNENVRISQFAMEEDGMKTKFVITKK